MMKDDELWLKKIKERLDDYSEPLPDAGWERLERAMPASSLMSVEAKKRILFRRWAVTAAAVVLVAVSSVSLWLMQSPVVDDVRRSVEPALAGMSDVLPEPTKPSVQGEQPEPVIRRVVGQGDVSHRQSLVAQHLKMENTELNAGEEFPGEDIETHIADVTELPVSERTGKVEEETTVSDQQITENAPVIQAGNGRRVSRPSGKDKLHLPTEKKSSESGKGWAVGLSVGNTGGSVLDNTVDNNPVAGPLFSNKLDLTDISNGVLSIPDGQELVFSGGLPYLRQNAPVIQDIKHKQPISFGLSVRKSLPKNFSVETGVTYTMLASEITYEGTSEKVDQKLHYIGIPVRANWNFVNNKSVTMYVSAGGAVEKCVYGKIADEKETVKPVQLSVMGAVGAQYNISNKVGIYVEPGVSYFFDDGSEIETIRKENPTNFTLQAGIRLTY